MKNEANERTVCEHVWPYTMFSRSGYPEKYEVRIDPTVSTSVRVIEGMYLSMAMEALDKSPFGTPHLSRYLLELQKSPVALEVVYLTIQSKQPLLIEIESSTGELLATIRSGR